MWLHLSNWLKQITWQSGVFQPSFLWENLYVSSSIHERRVICLTNKFTLILLNLESINFSSLKYREKKAKKHHKQLINKLRIYHFTNSMLCLVFANESEHALQISLINVWRHSTVAKLITSPPPNKRLTRQQLS